MIASYDELSRKYLEYVTLNNWAKTFPTADNILAAKNAKAAYLECLKRR